MVSILEAMVLRLSDYGESDRIVTLLTKHRGKISAIAKGARRSRKRFGGALSLFGYGDAKLRERRGSELWILEEFQSALGFSHLCQEMGRFGQASYVSELCRELCPQNEPEPEVFEQLYSFWTHLDGLPLEEKPRIEPLLYFELSLLRLVGLQISFLQCAVCGDKISAMSQSASSACPLDLDRGGALCRLCLQGSSPSSIKWLSEDVYASTCELEKRTMAKHAGAVLVFSREAQKVCREIFLWMIHKHLGKKLQTVDFIFQMNQHC